MAVPAFRPTAPRWRSAPSAFNLDPADTDSIYDIYVKDLATGNITLASTSDTGVKGNGDSYFIVLSADGATGGLSCPKPPIWIRPTPTAPPTSMSRTW